MYIIFNTLPFGKPEPFVMSLVVLFPQKHLFNNFMESNLGQESIATQKKNLFYV